MQRNKLFGQGALGSVATGGVLAAVLLAGATTASAQSAIIYGSVGNFDIANDTGLVCHGFEIEMDGLTKADVPYSFSTERYGAPTVSDYAGGVRVRWESPVDASGAYLERTLPHTTSWFPGQCYQWSGPAIYQDSGCEHFGTGVYGNPTYVSARWLCDDPASPGVLVAVDPPTAVPMPSYSVQQPAVVGNAPQLVMEVQAPEPAEAPDQYGDAQWMRVFVTEQPFEVNLDQLVADNPAVVPMNAAQLETNWDVIQTEPLGSNGKRQRKRNGGAISPTTRSIIRRIEMYAYTGAYDPVTHEALCADGLCVTPAADELGELLSVQMTGANVQSDSVTVTKTGSGNVDSTDRLISCGSKCVSPYTAGMSVTLTAKAASGSVFAGWSGACSGTQTSCTVVVSGHVQATANFVAAPSGGGGGGGGGGGTTTSGASLSVKTSGGKGLITSNPAGINCGSTCSTKLTPGSTITLSIVPEPGFRFVNWSGACTGTATSCTLTVSGSAAAQANLTK